MKVVKIDEQKWTEGIEALKQTYRLYGPVKGERFHNFTLLEKGMSPDFNFQNTRLSPKAIDYAQTEVILHYTLDESKEDHHVMKEVAGDTVPKAIVGIRPCDAAAFLLVKRNFDTPEYRDSYWVRAYHCAGRCTDCGACERACPMGIKVRLLTKKLEKDCLELFDWEAGLSLEVRPPLDTYKPDDPDKFIK